MAALGRSLAISLLTSLVVAASASAQTAGDPPTVTSTDRMTFDRPESWALKYFTSTSLLQGLDMPAPRRPGDVLIGLEVNWLPRLGADQQRVGFNGTTPEDLNKAPVFLRPRVTVGLPGRLALTIAVVPPFRAFGVKAPLIAAALDRALFDSARWTAAVRGYGQFGHAEAAFTCPKAVLAFAAGSAGNPLGCQAESADRAMLRYVGGQVAVAYRPGARLSPHGAVSLNYLDLAFQVNAPTFDYLDRTLLVANGWTTALSGGLLYRLTSRLAVSADGFYTPLRVRRTAGAPVQNDGLFNARALVVYRLRPDR